MSQLQAYRIPARWSLATLLSAGFLALKPHFTMKVDGVQSGDGTLALTRSTWSMTGTDPEGRPVTMGGRSAEVVRRQSDGTWKFVIDNPHGSENS